MSIQSIPNASQVQYFEPQVLPQEIMRHVFEKALDEESSSIKTWCSIRSLSTNFIKFSKKASTRVWLYNYFASCPNRIKIYVLSKLFNKIPYSIPQANINEPLQDSNGIHCRHYQNYSIKLDQNANKIEFGGKAYERMWSDGVLQKYQTSRASSLLIMEKEERVVTATEKGDIKIAPLNNPLQSFYWIDLQGPREPVRTLVIDKHLLYSISKNPQTKQRTIIAWDWRYNRSIAQHTFNSDCTFIDVDKTRTVFDLTHNKAVVFERSK